MYKTFMWFLSLSWRKSIFYSVTAPEDFKTKHLLTYCDVIDAWAICIQTTGVSSRAMTSQTVSSRFDLYPGYVLTESETFFRSNSRWYGCCDWLLVPRGVSLDSHRTWTDSWYADLLPRNKRIHSRNKRIHSRNKCIHSRKTVSVSRI